MEFLPVLELIDRLCIARVKHARTKGANQIELDWYEERLNQLPQSTALDQAIEAMTDIHLRNHVDPKSIITYRC